MTRKDLIEPRYTQSQVLVAARLTEKTLQNYIAREHFLVYSDFVNPGRGQRRFYSAVDVVLLAAMGELALFSIPPSVAGIYANSIRGWLLVNGSRSQTRVGDAVSGLPSTFFLFAPPSDSVEQVSLCADSWSSLEAEIERFGDLNSYVIVNAKQLVTRVIHRLQIRQDPKNVE